MSFVMLMNTFGKAFRSPEGWIGLRKHLLIRRLALSVSPAGLP